MALGVFGGDWLFDQVPDLLLLRTDATLSRVTGGRDSPGRLFNQIHMASVWVSPNSAGERLCQCRCRDLNPGTLVSETGVLTTKLCQILSMS